MKFHRIGVTASLLFLAAQTLSAWAQSTGANTGSQPWTQPGQFLFIPPQITDFERLASPADQPLVHVAFPAISADLGPRVSLNLTPRGLTPLSAPGALKAMAVEFQLSQLAPAHGAKVSDSHSVTALLDFDELPAFRSVFHALAATGMPRPPFPEAKAVVRMTSKSGLRLEFTAEDAGRIRCIVATDVDSVAVLLDADSAAKWADAFTEAFRTLDAAKDSRT